MDLVLFIGLQGSGKSSFYRERFAATHVHVSKDLWPNARRREARQRRLISEALAQGRSVVVDNTHPLVEDRAPLIAIGREKGARVVGYVFESDLEACLARNAARVGRARVEDKALHITWRKLRWPSYAEGFDALFHVRLDPEGGFHVSEWEGGR
ncbi:AAA family ATPase [Archangium sp.]|jgi:predicted kinase|uniref:AAA family ATPase n=1 Tax=Archangium sp. TaxID=1872627 RepID=UPI00389B224C